MPDIDDALAVDKPGARSLNTTSQLQQQVDLCSSEQITVQAFYMDVAFELGKVTNEDWSYLQQNNCVPSEEMLKRLFAVIYGWGVVDISKLYTPNSLP